MSKFASSDDLNARFRFIFAELPPPNSFSSTNCIKVIWKM